MNFLQSIFYLCNHSCGLEPAGGHGKKPSPGGVVSGLGLFSAVCLWLTLEAEFLAIALVLVYVGGNGVVPLCHHDAGYRHREDAAASQLSAAWISGRCPDGFRAGAVMVSKEFRRMN